MDEEIIKNDPLFKEKDKKSGGRGKETLFRVTYSNQISLIKIADNKAHLIISINSIIITVIFAVTGLKQGIDKTSIDLVDSQLVIPILMILLTSLLSITFAIRAAMPYVRKPGRKPKTTSAAKSSLLFFANISSRTLDDYLGEMKKLLKSGKSIRENMTIDIYNQAKVLSRKYDMLNVAYQIFMYGFIISVLLFIIMLIFLPASI